MNDVNTLLGFLQQHLPWHKARLRFIALFTLALVKLTTLNLKKIALALNPEAQVDSNYRRIQRFLDCFRFKQEDFARLLLALIPQQERFIVTMDRTNWQFGGRHINVLMIAIACEGIACPLLWSVRGKTGNSSTKERVALMKCLLKLVPAARIEALVADREFIGSDWFSFLSKQEVPFCIRLRKDLRLLTPTGRRRIGRYFSHLQLGQHRVLPGWRRIDGVAVRIVGMNYTDDKGRTEQLILATTAPVREALATYRRRWEVETLFAALKGRGFFLETTHVSQPKRIEKLVGLLALAFVWAHRVGEWLDAVIRPLRFKKHGRLERSLFRYGLDHLQSVLLNLSACRKQFRICLKILRVPGSPKVLSCT